MNKRTFLLVVCVFLSCGIVPASAKRAAPREVAPVVVSGIQYAAPIDAMGFVVATDVAKGKELWRVRVYEVKINPLLEQDVQHVYITTLTLEDGSLLVTNERGDVYKLDLKTRQVTRQGK